MVSEIFRLRLFQPDIKGGPSGLPTPCRHVALRGESRLSSSTCYGSPAAPRSSCGIVLRVMEAWDQRG